MKKLDSKTAAEEFEMIDYNGTTGWDLHPLAVHPTEISSHDFGQKNTSG